MLERTGFENVVLLADASSLHSINVGKLNFGTASPPVQTHLLPGL